MRYSPLCCTVPDEIGKVPWLAAHFCMCTVPTIQGSPQLFSSGDIKAGISTLVIPSRSMCKGKHVFMYRPVKDGSTFSLLQVSALVMVQYMILRVVSMLGTSRSVLQPSSCSWSLLQPLCWHQCLIFPLHGIERSTTLKEFSTNECIASAGIIAIALWPIFWSKYGSVTDSSGAKCTWYDYLQSNVYQLLATCMICHC